MMIFSMESLKLTLLIILSCFTSLKVTIMKKDKNNESKLARIIIRQFIEKIQNTDWSLLNSYT